MDDASLDVGMAFDSMDEMANARALADAAAVLRASDLPMKARGNLVKYLLAPAINLANDDADPFERAARIMDQLIRTWQAPRGRDG